MPFKVEAKATKQACGAAAAAAAPGGRPGAAASPDAGGAGAGAAAPCGRPRPKAKAKAGELVETLVSKCPLKWACSELYPAASAYTASFGPKPSAPQVRTKGQQLLTAGRGHAGGVAASGARTHPLHCLPVRLTNPQDGARRVPRGQRRLGPRQRGGRLGGPEALSLRLHARHSVPTLSPCRPPHHAFQVRHPPEGAVFPIPQSYTAPRCVPGEAPSEDDVKTTHRQSFKPRRAPGWVARAALASCTGSGQLQASKRISWPCRPWPRNLPYPLCPPLTLPGTLPRPPRRSRRPTHRSPRAAPRATAASFPCPRRACRRCRSGTRRSGCAAGAGRAHTRGCPAWQQRHAAKGRQSWPGSAPGWCLRRQRPANRPSKLLPAFPSPRRSSASARST
jgi:hypothetical protein